MHKFSINGAGKDPPKSKAKMIIQTGKVDKPQGRFAVEVMLLPPLLSKFLLSKFTFDDKSWTNGRKLINNEASAKLSFGYMVSPKIRTGLSLKWYRYNYEDTITIESNINNISTIFHLYTIGPYFIFSPATGSWKPYIGLSTGLFIFKPWWDKAGFISKKELEKRKNINNQSGFFGDITLGFDIRLSLYRDFRIAKRLLFARTKPMYGSGALTAGLVFHAGKGFPDNAEQRK